MTTCCVTSCNSRSAKDGKLSFFRFPSDQLIRKIWIDNCGLDFLHKKDAVVVRRNYRVCELHFEDRMFLNPSVKNRLTFNAVPTLFSGATLSDREEEDQEIKEEMEFETLCPTCLNPIIEEKPIIMSSLDYETTYVTEIETSSEGSSKPPLHLMISCPEKMKLLNEIKSKNQEIIDLKEKLNAVNQRLTEVNTIEQMLKLCKLHLTPSLYLFASTHVNHRNKKVKDLWYCDKMLDLAKTLYLLCPLNVYLFLQTIIPIPTPCVLRRILSNFNIILPTHSKS